MDTETFSPVVPKLVPGEHENAPESPTPDTDRLAAIADLRAVMVAWPDLPEAVKAGILAMVKASHVDKS